MRRCLSVCAGLAVMAAASSASAQYRPRLLADPPTGESYHVEIGGGFWNPTPAIFVSSEELGLRGTNIDFVSDLGVVKKRFPEFRVVLRPARKHKFRIHHIPIKYVARNDLSRDLVFNGLRYRIGLPVTSTFDWKAWRFGYEYDFVYRDWGFVGLVTEVKYSNVGVSLDSLSTRGFTNVKAPIPAVGGIGRVYVAPNISVTGELTGFKLPDRLDKDYRGRYLDFDLYGTLNFTDYIGVQVGYRAIDVTYGVDLDAGDLNLKGLYFMGVARF